MACDRWQVTRDTWHVTHDTWCGVNILSKFQLSSSNGLGFMMLWISGEKRITQLINQLINDEAVYRTAPATPGLLNTQKDVESLRERKKTEECYYVSTNTYNG